MDAISPQAMCLVCGSRAYAVWATAYDVEYHSTSDPFRYLRCESCGVLFIDPVPDGRLAEIYPTNYYSYATSKTSIIHGVKRTLDRRRFRRLLGHMDGVTLNLLDVGGGAGWELVTAREAEPRVARTTVVDLDPGARTLAEANGHAYHCMRIEDYETDERFNAVFLLNLIEHVSDPAGVLKKVRSLLTPNGVIVVKTPNHDAWDARLFRMHSWAGLHCPRHWVLFTRESFVSLVKSTSLVVDDFSYTQGGPFWAASLLATLNDMRIVTVSSEYPVVTHPLFLPLAAIFAGVDFVRMPFSHPSQMFFILRRDPAGGE